MPHHLAIPGIRRPELGSALMLAEVVPWTAAVLGFCRLELSAVPLGAFDIPQRAKEWGELKIYIAGWIFSYL